MGHLHCLDMISMIKEHFIIQGKTEPFIWPTGIADKDKKVCASILARDGYIVEEGIAKDGKSNWIKIFR